MPINFNDVSFTYSPRTPYQCSALFDINLEIKEGSFTCLVGKTGSGKSTLIQQLNGLLVPSKGEVVVDEFVVSSDKKRRTKKLQNLRKKVGIVFQFSEYQLFEETVEKDVAFGPQNFGVKKEEAIIIAHECLKVCGLDESYYAKSPFELSGGEKRRVAIAGILALQPKVLVLDEPTAGLDPQGCKEMMALFQKMNASGVTIIVVTHDMNIVLEYASDVVVMDNGRVAKQCAPEELFLEDDEKFSLETPLISRVAKMLFERGAKIDVKNIRDIDSLADAIAKARTK